MLIVMPVVHLILILSVSFFHFFLSVFFFSFISSFRVLFPMVRCRGRGAPKPHVLLTFSRAWVIFRPFFLLFFRSG